MEVDVLVVGQDAYDQAFSDQQIAFFVNRANRLLSVRRPGWDLHSHWGLSKQFLAEQREFTRAVEVAGDEGERRRFLVEAAHNLADYDKSRVELYRGEYLLALAEERRLREAGAAETDPAGMAEAEARSKRIGAMSDQLIEHDRAHNTSVEGKRVLREHLETGTPFVLLLRAFELETRRITTDVPFPTDLTQDKFPDIREKGGWVVAKGPSQRTLYGLATALAPRLPSIMIMNSGDFTPTSDAARLFVSAHEWRTLVFSLVAEAAAIVVVLPKTDRPLSAGVLEELRAIRELRAVSRTVVALEPMALSHFRDADQEGLAPAWNHDEAIKGITRIIDTDGDIAAANTQAVAHVTEILDAAS